MAGVWQSLVYIETYSNFFYRGDTLRVKTFLLDGLGMPRQFYSPRYEGASRNNSVYDSRATLYWNPSVLTNENGQAKIEFFTSDRKTEFEIVVNGMDIWSGAMGMTKILINY